jgi:hypothetical protein
MKSSRSLVRLIQHVVHPLRVVVLTGHSRRIAANIAKLLDGVLDAGPLCGLPELRTTTVGHAAWQ